MAVPSPSEVLAHFDARWAQRWPSASAHRAPAILTGCATTDITQPYHSISYLGSVLERAGQPYLARDLGIEFWHYVMAPSVVAELRRECQNRQGSESDPERRQLLGLYIELLEDGSAFMDAFAALRDPERFHDIDQYLGAIRRLNLLPRLLTLLARRSVYRTFSSASPPGSAGDRIDLSLMRAEVERGLGVEILDAFYDHHADRIAARSPCLVGLTIPFISQLEHSLLLGARLRQRGVKVAIGGPIAAKFYKYIEEPEKLGILGYAADYLATGEGETLICQLVDALRNGKETTGLENLVDLARPRPLERIHFEKVDDLPAPDYGLWDYELYASPEPGGLYSPTRGCYWNKCSFCDYGLATDGPTSPWRVRSPAQVADDLERASEHIRYFFFAVDVLSPAYALKLSRELIERKVDLKWMADFRLESAFRADKVGVFAEAGCLGAAFGMESADQTVVNLMQKGTKVSRLSNVVGAFADSGIPVQLMGFTGFPGETYEQAKTTFSTAEALLGKAATVALGKFGLTPGSDVARRPEHYGVEVLYEASDDKIAIPWELDWRLKREIETYPEDDFTESLRLVRGFPYPFLGATSTLHSLLYFERCARAPFPIPYWSYELIPGPFRAFPFYQRGTASDGEVTLQSGLTGRALVVDSENADTIDAIFEDGGPVATRDDLPEHLRRFLDFLVEHSLALFVPQGSEA